MAGRLMAMAMAGCVGCGAAPAPEPAQPAPEPENAREPADSPAESPTEPDPTPPSEPAETACPPEDAAERQHCVVLDLKGDRERAGPRVIELLITRGYEAIFDSSMATVGLTAVQAAQLFGAEVTYHRTAASGSDRMICEPHLGRVRIPPYLRPHVRSAGLDPQVC